MYTPTAKGYFSGCGGMEIGVMQSGVSVIQSLDLDPEATHCMKMNSHYFSHPVLTCDIKDKTVLEQPKTDIIIGTYPCTKYSPIVDIHGVRTGDDLFLHFLRHVAIRRPELYVVENVPGMKKFPVVMEAMTKLPDYYVHVACPVRTSTWLPQKRDRLIIIGSRRNFMWREPTAKRATTLAEILEPEPTPHIPDYVHWRLAGKYRDRPIISDPKRGDIAPTCVAHYAKDLSTRLVADTHFPHGVRPYTVREYARMQGVPDTFTFSGSDNDAYRMIGNGVSVPIGEWIACEIKRYFK